MELPRLLLVRQSIPDRSIQDIPGTIARELSQAGFASRLRPGSCVSIGVGSRGIARIEEITRSVVEEVRALGGEPFIVPAMGSHGSSTAEGQKEILSGYGITEEFCGCPVRSSMDTVLLGHTADGDPV